MAGIIFLKTKKSKEIRDFYAHSVLQVNDKYIIYHFFARDPEDRIIEFQSFLHSLKEWPAADTGGVR